MDKNLHIDENGRGALRRGRLRNLKLIIVIMALSCLCATAQEADVPDIKELHPAMQAMGTVTEFHRMAMGEPEKAAEMFCENRCFRRWKQRMEPLKKAQLVDFFVGAMEITGSYDRTSAVSALYNPFWDTILLLELNLPEAGGKGTIVKFAMLAGETFRGEKPTKYPFRTVVAKNSLFMELANVFSKTAAHFDKTFPQKAAPSLGEFALSRLEDEMPLVGLRSTLRISLMRGMLKNKEDVKIMKSMQIVLQHGKQDSLNKIFAGHDVDTHIRTLMDMPPDVREQFVLYSYYTTPEYTVFAYVPLFMPRLIAVVKVPKQQPAPASLEIYDLNDSAAIMAVADKMKGGKK